MHLSAIECDLGVMMGKDDFFVTFAKCAACQFRKFIDCVMLYLRRPCLNESSQSGGDT